MSHDTTSHDTAHADANTGAGAVPPIWRPDPAVAASSAIAEFGRFVTGRTGVEFGEYLDLWRWSADHLEEFWTALWDFFGIEADGSHAVALDESAAVMPGARWFPGTRLNYAEHALRRRPGDDDIVAVTTVSEDGTTVHTTWAELRAQVAALAQWLRDAGVEHGDRVVGYLPDTTPTLVAFLATASVGAIWSACAQDYGADGAAAGQRADDVGAPELGVDRLVQMGEYLARLAEHDVGRLRRPQRRKQRGDVRVCLGHAGYSGTP